MKSHSKWKKNVSQGSPIGFSSTWQTFISEHYQPQTNNIIGHSG